MFNYFKENITLDKLRQDEDKLTISTSDSYLISYPEFLKYFSDIQTITEHNLIIGINFTYGWMPTIFDFRSNRLSEVTRILNSAKQGKIPIPTDLEVLKKCLNNSLVGVSKLLHFINPIQFAIWDSRVYRYLTNKDPHSYRLDNYNSYLDYLRFCNYISITPDFEPIHNSVEKKVGYSMTPFRTAELIMFFNGGRIGNK